MPELTIYRIQDKDGRGPWKPGFSRTWIEDRPDHDNLTPWPFEFPGVGVHLSRGMHNGCATRTIEQLKRWFTESEYRTLLQHGYQAVKMTATRILAESEIQCVFERSTPLRKNATPFNLYEKETA